MSSVLGIGNALVDILARIEDDSLLKELNLPKGSMQLIDNNGVELLYKKAGHLLNDKASGGSAANTIDGLANLGIKTGFIGKIGDDEIGNFFKSDLEKSNIKPFLLKGENSSGTSTVLISPDSERTLATFLGAAIELSASDLKKEMFEGYTCFHIEGYLVQNYELVEAALKLAKDAGLKNSLDLASYNVVEENLEFLKYLTDKYVDVLFANEEEARAFTGKEEYEALEEMSRYADVAILKLGKKGSIINYYGEIVKVDVVPAKSIDTTGAGDLYAAGFLYGMANGLTPEQCGKIGSVTSGNVIEVIGAKMDEERWKKIKEKVSEIMR
ncbi:MAG: adenosine kinase [Chlorobi bacterium]|nr:adenosine kinase [Chlorobiota bacterium]